MTPARCFLLVLALPLALVLVPLRVQAQTPLSTGRLAYVLDDREEIQTLLKSVEDALLQGTPTRAVDPLLTLLLRSRDEVFFVGGELHIGVRQQVRRIMAGLPGDCIEAARKVRAVEARTLLQRGQATDDEATLWRCFAQFTFTRAGADALEILADRAFERGDIGLAFQCFRRFLATYRPRKAYEDLPWARILAKAGSAAASLGKPLALTRIRAAAASVSGVRLTIGHEPIDVRTYLQGLTPAPPTPSPPGKWTTFGGNAGRSARPTLVATDFTCTWTAKDFPDIDDWERIGERKPHHRDYTCLQPPYPVVAGGRVYSFNGRVLTVQDLNTGTLIAKREFRPTNPADRANMPYRFRHLTLAPEGIFLLTENDPELTNKPTQRVLHAFDPPGASTTLSIRWTRGGPGDPDPCLADALLTGSPVRAGNKVFIGGTVRSTDDRVFLFALHPRTGRLAWKRFLCAGAGQRAKAQFQREMGLDDFFDLTHGEIMVSEDQGVLYVSTNMGVVAALSRGDGEILWLLRYPSRSRPQNPSNRPAVLQLPWLDNPLLVVGNRLFLTPRDSDYLHVLNVEPDLDRGLVQAARCKKTRLDAEFLYLVGAETHRVYLAERRWVGAEQTFHITALNINEARSEEAWTFEIPHVSNEEEGPAEYFTGRAQLTMKHVLVPTNKAVYILDLETGRRVHALTIPEKMRGAGIRTFGNLIPGGVGFLSALPASVSYWVPLTSGSRK